MELGNSLLLLRRSFDRKQLEHQETTRQKAMLWTEVAPVKELGFSRCVLIKVLRKSK